MDSLPSQPKRKRNVEVFNSEGEVVAGFWQHGTVRWDEFYRYTKSFLVVSTEWSIFEYDLERKRPGEKCPPSPDIMQPGQYIVLPISGERVHVKVVAIPSRPRILTHLNTFDPEFELSDYHTRAYNRDCNGKCMITGFQTEGNSGIGAAHVFPQEQEEEWVRRGYPNKIIDTADEWIMGGPTKIDSIQNILTLRLDLCGAWDNYEFGVDPNNNYRITDFIWGNRGINGLHLRLDHIQDSTLRPLDELFTDHFIQCIYRHMKGSGEAGWTDEDITALMNGTFNMSGFQAWDTMQGKQLFELALANRLFYPSISQYGEYSQDSKPTSTEDGSK